MARNIKLDGRAIRQLCMLLTRPDEKRNLRDAKTAQEIDNKLRNLNEPYDERLENIARRMQKLRATYRMDDPEFQLVAAQLQDEVNSLDATAEDNLIEFVLEDKEYDYVENMLRELRGVPTDRVNGPVYLRMQEAFDKAEKVQVTKVT